MSRLPVPGQDTDIWGDILNDFLSVSHNADGTIKTNALPPTQVPDGSITPSKLSRSYIPAADKGIPSGVATLDSSGKVPSSQLPPADSVSDATTSTKGVVQLAGDLGGTAAAPTVPGLANKVNTSSLGAANGVAMLDGSTKLVDSQVPNRLSQTSLDNSYARFTSASVSHTTGVLAASAQATGTIAIANVFLLMKINVSVPARIRLYASAAQRDADKGRPRGTDPAMGTDHGIILDVAFQTAGSLVLSPNVVGSCSVSDIPFTIDNLGGSSAAVTVNITYLRME